MRPQVITLLIAIPIAVLGSAPAHACSCAGGSWPVWPPDGATDIPLDAPIVVATSDLTEAETKLTADDGSEIELVEKGRLEMGQADCVNHQYLFLTPRELLQPQRRYVVVAHGGVWNPLIAGALAPQPATFVTGSALRDATPPELTLDLYATLQPEGRALELFVQAPVTEPIFIGVSGQPLNYAVAALPPSASRSRADPFELHFGVVDCATPTFVDVTGNTFASPQLCEPSKCLGPRPVVWGPCGGYPSPPLTWEEWQELPDGCSAPADDGSPNVSDGGCTLQPTAPRSAASAPVLIAAPALLSRARRSRTRGSSLRGSARR